MFIYPAGPGSLKKRQTKKKLLIVCLSGRAWKFKRKKGKKLFIFYPTGPESLKERQKVVNCLFIRQGQKVKKAKGCLLFVYMAGPGSLKEVKSCYLVIYPSGPGSLKERQKVVYCLFIWQVQKV